jgi:peptidyl-lysine (3S)-dioxygenase / protease
MSILSDLLQSIDSGVEAWVPSAVPRVLASDMTPHRFKKEYLGRNLPVVIVGGASHWPAMGKWSTRSLAEHYGDTKVTVNYTPDGWGDALVRIGSSTVFVAPLEKDEQLRGILEALALTAESHCRAASRSHGLPSAACETSSASSAFDTPGDRDHAFGCTRCSEICCTETGVPYLSFQNDNLRCQLPELLKDIGCLPCVGWNSVEGEDESSCDDALGSRRGAFGRPDAINLWIGDARSVSWVHKDHYENLYTVVRGSKRFMLLPPMALPGLYERRYACGRYARTCCRSSDVATDVAPGWTVVIEGDAAAASATSPTGVTGASTQRTVPWVSVNLSDPDFAAFPAYASVQV